MVNLSYYKNKKILYFIRKYKINYIKLDDVNNIEKKKNTKYVILNENITLKHMHLLKLRIKFLLNNLNNIFIISDDTLNHTILTLIKELEYKNNNIFVCKSRFIKKGFFSNYVLLRNNLLIKDYDNIVKKIQGYNNKFKLILYNILKNSKDINNYVDIIILINKLFNIHKSLNIYFNTFMKNFNIIYFIIKFVVKYNKLYLRRFDNKYRFLFFINCLILLNILSNKFNLLDKIFNNIKQFIKNKNLYLLSNLRKYNLLYLTTNLIMKYIIKHQNVLKSRPSIILLLTRDINNLKNTIKNICSLNIPLICFYNVFLYMRLNKIKYNNIIMVPCDLKNTKGSLFILKYIFN